MSPIPRHHPRRHPAHRRNLAGAGCVQGASGDKGQIMRIRTCLTALVLLVLGFSTIRAQDVPQPAQVLGMATIPRLEPTPVLQDYLDAFKLTHDVGVNANIFNDKWNTFEPQPEQYQIDDYLDGMNSYLAAYPDTVLLGIQVLNTTAKEAPPDLQDVPFDDPRMLQRFNALLDAMLAKIDHPVRYLSIGNEVDVYLENHPDEWDAYTRFYEGALAHAHKVAPGMQVGVTVTFDGLIRHADEVERLNARSDVLIVTYYPLGAAFVADNPDAPLTDFPKLVQLADGLPVVLQEVGYPSAALLGSSEAEQAQFVRSVFSAWKAAGSAIPFLDYFALHDFTEDWCNAFEGYYGLKHPNFHAYLCTLGLRQADGTPKAAWDAFAQAAREWKAKR